jgi:hypothetical protein
MSEQKQITPGIADRLYKLLTSILEDGTVIPAMYHKVILNLVKPFLLKSSDSDLESLISRLRDELIPWILYGDSH